MKDPAAARGEHVSAGEARPRGWWLWAAWVGLALLFLAVSIQKLWAGDFWGQLRAGQWILANGRVPAADWFTFTREGTPWIEVRWLYEVAIALVWRAGGAGPYLLGLAQAALLGVMWWVLIRGSKLAVRSPWGLLVLGLAIAAGTGRWVLRPELITDLMVALFLVGLEAQSTPATGSKPRPWRGWWLVLAQVVWVNTHSVFALGPIFAWTFVGSEVAERLLHRAGIRWPVRPADRSTAALARLALLALLITAACWVNPYFHRGAMYAYEMWRESRSGHIVAESLGELRSPLKIPIGIWRWDLWASLLLAVAVAGTFAVNWRRAGIARWIIFAAAVYLAASAQRNVVLLSVMGGWAGLRNIEDWLALRAERPASIVRDPRLARIALAAIGATAAGFGWYVASDRSWIAIGAPRESGLGVVWWDTPRAAAGFVAGNSAPPQVFNNMRDGHFLGWYTDGAIRPYVDGRTDVMGDELMREFFSVGPATCDEVTRRRGINTAIVPVRWFGALIQHLVRSPEWALVHLDHRNVVFIRSVPEHADFIQKHRIDVAAPWRPRGPEPDDSPDAWKLAIGGRGRAWYTQGMAETFIALGAVGNAHTYVLRTLEKLPTSQRALAQHAALSRFGNEHAQGDAAAALLEPVWAAYGDELLAGWLMEAGRRAEAMQVLLRMVKREPDLSRLRVALADLYFQAGGFERAREEYEAAVRLGHDTAAEWLKLAASRERTGDPRAAIAAYRRSLALDPAQAPVWRVLGRLLASGGDLAGAEDALERALKIDPAFGAAREDLDAVRKVRSPGG